MSIKKMLLLLSALAAFVAFAAPAAAQAESAWTSNGVLIGGPEEQTTVEGTGTLQTQAVGSPLVSTAEVHVHGFLWNGGVHGEGVIDEFVITPGTTNLPGCSFNGTNSTKGGNEGREEEWPITLTTENPETGTHGVDISNVTFANDYSEFCQKTYGLPARVPASGTVSGDYNNATGCIEFIQAGSLAVEGGGPAITLNGQVCLEDPEGGTITAD
jgi:hypothetical protein